MPNPSTRRTTSVKHQQRVGIDEASEQRRGPYQVRGLDAVVSIDAGGWHTIAVRTDGTVWTWGGNWSGQLGVTPTSRSDFRSLPLQVPGPCPVSPPVSGGLENSLAISP